MLQILTSLPNLSRGEVITHCNVQRAGLSHGNRQTMIGRRRGCAVVELTLDQVGYRISVRFCYSAAPGCLASYKTWPEFLTEPSPEVLRAAMASMTIGDRPLHAATIVILEQPKLLLVILDPELELTLTKPCREVAAGLLDCAANVHFCSAGQALNTTHCLWILLHHH